jgi:hypothetical protein
MVVQQHGRTALVSFSKMVSSLRRCLHPVLASIGTGDNVQSNESLLYHAGPCGGRESMNCPMSHVAWRISCPIAPFRACMQLEPPVSIQFGSHQGPWWKSKAILVDSFKSDLPGKAGRLLCSASRMVTNAWAYSTHSTDHSKSPHFNPRRRCLIALVG